jgi:hypothetical protein
MNQLQATTETRPADWRAISQEIAEYRRGDFRRISALIAKYWPRSAPKRQQRNPPFVSAFALNIAPHYRHAPSRTWRGEPRTSFRIEDEYTRLGMQRIFREMTHRAVTQGTALAVWLPTQALGWAVVLLDPWEVEVDPDPFRSQSVSNAREIRLRLPRTAAHDRIDYQVAVMRQSDGAAYWMSDGAPLYPGGGLPLGRYPVAVCHVGEAKPGDFFAPIPEWLAQAQRGLSLAYSDIEFRNRYASGQLVGYGMASETPDSLDFGPDVMASTHGSQSDVRIENIDRPFDAASAMAAVDGFRGAIHEMTGLPPSELGGAVTAEALHLKIWAREEIRADLTDSFQRMELSMAAAARVALGWDFGAGEGELPYAAPVVQYRMPEPPRNPLHTAQAQRMQFEDGTKSPADILLEAMPGLTEAEALARAIDNGRLYGQIKQAADPRAAGGDVSGGPQAEVSDL